MKTVATLLLLVVAGDGGSPFDVAGRGLAALREGRGEAALTDLQAVASALGDAAPAELHYDVALAALQCGQPAVAEAAAERAVARGGAPFELRRTFVHGCAAFYDGEVAAGEASLPDADPTLFDRAIHGMEAARDAWIAAATSRDDWPQARRNVERALRKLDELTRAKAERMRKRAPTPNAAPPPSEPDPVAKPEDKVPAVVPEAELTPSQIERLFEILQRDEEEKVALRRARRAARPAASPSERDW